MREGEGAWTYLYLYLGVNLYNLNNIVHPPLLLLYHRRIEWPLRACLFTLIRLFSPRFRI